MASDAKTWSLPWIQAEVRIAETTATDGTVTAWRTAESGEKGELVITQPYPYLARTLWGDADNLFERDWCGDIARFNAVYFSRWDGELAYTQGPTFLQNCRGCLPPLPGSERRRKRGLSRARKPPSPPR